MCIKLLRFAQLACMIFPLCITIMAQNCMASPASMTWKVNSISYSYNPATRNLTANCHGVRFEPLKDFGPTFLFRSGDKSAATAGASLISAKQIAGGISCRYKVRVADEAAEYTLDIKPVSDGLQLHLYAATTPCTRVSAGKTTGLGKWYRIPYTRSAEAYAQPFWPSIAWDPAKKVYVAALWKMAASNGTSWEAAEQRFEGKGSFASAEDVVYTPRTDGARMPLNETLMLHVGQDLWRTVPMPAQKPSQYAHDLAHSIFLDVWGGTAQETEYFLRYLSLITRNQAHFFTIFENWQAGGFDALNPDSILMPAYPPNPGIGTIDEFQSLSRFARSVGRFGLRTNYVDLRPASPSAIAGSAVQALKPDGTKEWYTRPSDWLPLAQRQETEIQQLFHTNAGFTDQMTSSGGPWSYIDFDARQPNAGSMAQALRRQRALATLIKTIHHGPLGSESNMDEQLLGEYVDTGDFGMFDGYHRAMTPEFKLHRLQQLSVFYGMGLMYRYFEMPPFKKFSSGTANYLSDPAQYDDYRAAEVLYGNGGYLFYYPGMPWDYVVTESFLVGTLQRRYLLQPVQDVLYWKDGRWQTLQEIVKSGINPLTADWNPQTDCLKLIQVRYKNGLHIVVNRMTEEFPVKVGTRMVILPRSGWVAWDSAGKLTAYSAYAPGTRHRVDFIHDSTASLQYLNPRGQKVMGQTQPTLWLHGNIVMRLDPASGNAWVDGELWEYSPPLPQPLTHIDFHFDSDTQGWIGQSDISPLKVKDGALTGDIIGPDPYMSAPTIDLAPDSVKEIVVSMRINCGAYGQIYFVAKDANATLEQMSVRFPVKPGSEFQEIHIPVGDNPFWKGHRIISLRFDPERGFSPCEFAVKWIRGK
jgi:hypothetical protein